MMILPPSNHSISNPSTLQPAIPYPIIHLPPEIPIPANTTHNPALYPCDLYYIMRPKISPFTGVKVNVEVGLKSTQAGCPMPMLNKMPVLRH